MIVLSTNLFLNQNLKWLYTVNIWIWKNDIYLKKTILKILDLDSGYIQFYQKNPYSNSKPSEKNYFMMYTTYW